ncbi:MAG: hypothetical protein WC214_03635 [Candidatus Omnitrophota bacterium]
MNKKTIKNKKWITPEIIRIKLNPEQAVLSCCDSSLKIAIYSEIQCMTLTVCGGSMEGHLSS